MTLDEFVVLFAEQFDDTDASEIKADTSYQDLEEWSSMTAMAIMAFVKTALNKAITGKEIRECDTVEDLYNLVMSK